MRLLELHQGLLADESGQESFRRAIQATLRGGETVLDLGTGTGIHALFACQAGARHVFAVERDPIIASAREVARANGCQDHITFLHGPAGELELPEPVDVLITHPGYPRVLELLPPCRDRFLKPGGRVIPRSLRLFCAPLESSAAYEVAVQFWQRPHYDLDFGPVRSLALNTTHEWHIQPREILGQSALLLSCDLQQVQDPRLEGCAELTVTRQGVFHGLGFWPELGLTDEISLSTAPPCQLSSPEWCNEFLPAPSPVPVDAGDAVRVRVQNGMGGWGKIWHWEVLVRERNGGEKSRFVSSTLAFHVPTRDALAKQALDHQPRLTPNGEALRFILESCDGSRPLAWIEAELASRFPSLCRTPGEAAWRLSKAISRYAD